jgi:hypothetical protein
MSEKFVGVFRSCCSSGKCAKNHQLRERVVRRFTFLPLKVGEMKIWFQTYYQHEYFRQSYGRSPCCWEKKSRSLCREIPTDTWAFSSTWDL